MAGLALITIVSLPFLYSEQRKEALQHKNRYSYYTGNPYPEHSYENKIVDFDFPLVKPYLEGISYKSNLLKSIRSFLDEKKISLDVFNNLYLIVDKLPEEIINLIDLDNIYVSEVGTAIIDICSKGSIFSLEIGKSKLGYFAEIDNNFVFQNDGLDFTMNNSENLPILFADLLSFSDKIPAV